MDVRTLRYFVLVAEEGSIHGGARRALIAQPALSVALRKLERELGAALFDRSPRGVRLTAAGQTLLPRARQILRDLDELAVELPRADNARPEFTVGLIEGRVSAGELTGPILDAFQAGHPELRLRVRELNFVEQFTAVLDGRVDVALVRGPYEHDELCMEPLFSEPSVIAASPSHPLAGLMDDAALPVVLPLEAVLDEPMLAAVRTPRPWRNFWSLSELRNGSGRSIASHEVGLLGYCVDVMRNSAVSPMALSAWRLGALGGISLRAARLPEAPHSVVGVGYRRDTAREEVRAFADLARLVTEQLVAVIPDGTLIPADQTL
jgi:DNA-binding transcriptional LysR family regulator